MSSSCKEYAGIGTSFLPPKNRWSFVNRFGKVSYSKFREFAFQLVEELTQEWGPLRVEIEMYHRLPWSTTSISAHETKQETFRESNARRLSKVVQGLDQFYELAFDRAAFVRVVIHPEDPKHAPESAFAVLDAIGFLSDRVTFYVQPDKSGDKVFRLMEKMNNCVFWKVGDGWENHYPVSFS